MKLFLLNVITYSIITFLGILTYTYVNDKNQLFNLNITSNQS